MARDIVALVGSHIGDGWLNSIGGTIFLHICMIFMSFSVISFVIFVCGRRSSRSSSEERGTGRSTGVLDAAKQVKEQAEDAVLSGNDGGNGDSCCGVSGSCCGGFGGCCGGFGGGGGGGCAGGIRPMG
ncbi:hypothetical protein TIFTF001_032706 [Ficus carica]|uniref:Uncharacterized protein n=1 Tax=Ficus carica TaxID=3494 RepID=A0AA88DXI5_FICCA|nr:hypothetical protein TIFTF001_032706 [Ficus carica]